MKKSANSIEDISIELIDKQDIQSLLSKLAECTNCGVAYRDVIKIRTYAHSANYDFIEMVKTYPISELKRLFHCFWLVESNLKCGCLIIEKETVDHSIINAALIGIRILIRHELQEQRRRKKYASILIWDIITRKNADEATLIESLRPIGIRKDYFCLLFIIEQAADFSKNANNEENILWADEIEKRLFAFFAHVFFIKKNEKIWCVLMFDEKKQSNKTNLKEETTFAMKTIMDAMPTQRFQSYLGVSSPRCSLTELSECAYEAANSIIYAKIQNLLGIPVYWETIGSFRILFAVSREKEANLLCERILGRLITNKATHKNDLLKTLHELITNNWNIRRTAEKMAFHQNTVKYRYRKISELLDGDINDSVFRFDLDFALKLHLIRVFSSQEGMTDGQ